MLSEIFYWVLNATVIGSGAGLIILLLRKIKPLPRFAVYVLWIIPLIRFWIPFGISNKYSLLELISKFATKTVVIRDEFPGITVTNTIMGAESYFPIEYKNEMLRMIFETAAVVWVIVAVGCISTTVLLYMLTMSELKKSDLITDNIYKSDSIAAPAVYGIIRPKIIIPSGASEKHFDYIIMHETVHIKRMDNLMRTIAVITSCIHWFNPLIWIFLKYFFTDMELSCDAGVLKKLDENRGKEYAASILACARGSGTLFISAFGGAKTRARIENILSYKKLTLFSSIFITLLVAAITVVLITNANV